jgi:hypothetical protein
MVMAAPRPRCVCREIGRNVADPPALDEFSFQQAGERISQRDVREAPTLEIDDTRGFISISDVIEDYAIDFIGTDGRDV